MIDEQRMQEFRAITGSALTQKNTSPAGEYSQPSVQSDTSPEVSGSFWSGLSQVINFPTDITKGAMKGIVDLPREFASLGQTAGEAFSHTQLGESIGNFLRDKLGGTITPDVASQISEGMKRGVERSTTTVPTTAGEKVGYTAEKIGEFFVPGVAAEQVASKVASEIPQIAELASAISKTTAGKTLLGALKLGGESVAAGSVATVQSGDIKEGEKVAVWTALLTPALTVTFNKVFPAVSKYLQESSLRLTPTQKSNLSSKIESAINFLSEKKIVGSAESRYDKVSAIYDDMESALQNTLKDSNVTVSVDSIVGQLENLKPLYKSDRDAVAIYRQIDSAIDTLKTMNPSGVISAEDLNIFKRTTMNGAWNKAGDKVSDAVEYDIGEAAYNSLAKALEDAGVLINDKTLRAFNEEYSSAITARKLLKLAMGRKQAGFLAKIVSSIAGYGVGSVFGGGIGAAIGTVAAPALSEAIAGGATRTGTATLLNSLSKMSALDLLKVIYGSLPKD